MNSINKPLVDASNLAELFGQGETFVVPPYQREYAWDDEQINALTEDLLDFYHDNEPYYILGQVILAPNSAQTSAAYRHAIVDGQQRLTSLYLLFMALDEQFASFGISLGDVGDEARLHHAVRQVLYSVRASDGEEQPRLFAIRQAQSAIEKLLSREPLKEFTSSVSEENVKQNYENLSSWVRNTFITKNDLTGFTRKLLYSVFIITARLESEEQALEIFEKINNRGKALNAAQLFKNLLFMQVKQAEYEAIDNYWTEAGEEVFKVKPHKAASMEYLMQALLQPHTGSFVSSKNVYKAWQPILKGYEGTIESFAKSLLTSAKTLALIGSTSKTRLNAPFVASKYFGVVQHLPIALVSSRFADENFEVYESVCGLLDARIALSLFASEGANRLNEQIWRWSKAIASVPLNSTFEEVVAALDFSEADFNLLANDSRPRFLNLNYKTLRDKKRIRFALAYSARYVETLANNHADSNPIDSMLVSAGKATYDLDHIYPRGQASSPTFDMSSGIEWLDQIGNICLLHKSDNRSAQDTLPSRKNAHYLSSALVLTQALATEESAAAYSNPRIASVVNSLKSRGAQNVASWGADTSYAQANFYFELFMEALKVRLGL